MVRLIDLTKVVDLDGINQIKQTNLIKSVLCFTLNFQKKTFKEGERVLGFFQNTGQHKWCSWEPCTVVGTILNGKFLILLIDIKYMNIISMFKLHLFIVIDNHF